MLAAMTAPERPQDEGEAPLRLLLVEDDVKLGRLTATYLESHKLAVTWVQDGEAGLDEALRHTYDVMLLDLMLPKMDGIEVCRRVRAQSDLPIVMLTARDEEADRVMGLELGADDYVTKPYSSRELLARVRALVRRRRGQAGPRARALEVGQLRLDPGSMQATLRGEPLHLTTHEFKLLYALAERAGRVLSREMLLDLTKGSADEAFDRAVDAAVSRLRRKLGDDPRRPSLLVTVRGAGYKFKE